MDKYLKCLIERRLYKLLLIPKSDIERLGFVGDGIWKACVTGCMAHRNISAEEMHKKTMPFLTNKYLSQFFPNGFPMAISEHLKATYVEAAVYLEVEEKSYEVVKKEICQSLSESI
jgi:hypothetical protein